MYLPKKGDECTPKLLTVAVGKFETKFMLPKVRVQAGELIPGSTIFGQRNSHYLLAKGDL